GLPKSKWNSTLGMASPFLCEGANLALERPGVAGLLINLPVGLGDRCRPHQPAWIEIGEGGFALPLLDPLAHPGGVDARIDDQMGDVDVPWTELACGSLRHSAKAELGAGEGGIADPAARAGGGAGKEDVAPAARQHQARGLARSQEARVTGHLPDLAEYPLGGLEQWEIYIGADVEDADFERCGHIGVLEERSDLLRLARIQRAPDDPSACCLDIGNQRRQLVTLPSPGKNGKPFGRKFLGNRRANEIAGADHRRGGISVFQVRPPIPLQWLDHEPR